MKNELRTRRVTIYIHKRHTKYTDIYIPTLLIDESFFRNEAPSEGLNRFRT